MRYVRLTEIHQYSDIEEAVIVNLDAVLALKPMPNGAGTMIIGCNFLQMIVKENVADILNKRPIK